jgi:hypothetical protein
MKSSIALLKPRSLITPIVNVLWRIRLTIYMFDSWIKTEFNHETNDIESVVLTNRKKHDSLCYVNVQPLWRFMFLPNRVFDDSWFLLNCQHFPMLRERPALITYHVFDQSCFLRFVVFVESPMTFPYATWTSSHHDVSYFWRIVSDLSRIKKTRFPIWRERHVMTIDSCFEYLWFWRFMSLTNRQWPV